MAIEVIKPGLLGRLYYSAQETTPGTLVIPTLSYQPIKHSLTWQEQLGRSKQITGQDGINKLIRECLHAGGSVSDYAEPGHFGFVLHHALNAAATSSHPNLSTTAYKHVWNLSPNYPPDTFTIIKQNAGGIVEEWGGSNIEGWTLSGGSGSVMLDYNVTGMGSNYNPNATEPVVAILTDAANVPFPSVQTNLIVDGTPIATGDFLADWKVTYSAAQGVNKKAAGSTDGSCTRVSKNGRQSIKASFKLIIKDDTYPLDFQQGNFHSWEFQCIGALIDGTTTPKCYSTIDVKIMSGRIINKMQTDLGEEGDYVLPVEIEGVIDQSSGFLGEYYTIDLAATA